MNSSIRWSAALAVAFAALSLFAVAAEAQTGVIEVRISARNTDGSQVEFALQERNATGEWQERILPRRRFFSDVSHSRWLTSSVVRLESVDPSIVARIIARKRGNGSIEFGLQWGLPGTRWGEQIFPQRRFFPDIDHIRWLDSSAVLIGPDTAATEGETPTRVLNVLTSSGDGSGAAPAVTRYRLLAGERYAFRVGNRTTPTLLVPENASLFHETREFDHLETGFAPVLIFPSGLELVLHPDTLDSILQRSDITDPVAIEVIDSMRRSIAEEASGNNQQSTGDRVQASIPFPTGPIELNHGSFVSFQGSGTIVLRSQGRQLTLTLPSNRFWFISSLHVNEPRYEPGVYVVAAPEQYVIISWLSGAELGRVVNPGPQAANLNALFDEVVGSVRQE